MTPKENHLLKDNHNYSEYTGKMGKVFNDWNDKKIDGKNAVQKIKQWYEKGCLYIKKEHADIQKKELKRHFDFLVSFINKHDLVDDEASFEPRQNVRNELVDKMIKEGVLSKDGKTPLKNLDNVAYFLIKHGQVVTVRALKDLGLKKRNSQPYSERTYKKALDIANTQ